MEFSYNVILKNSSEMKSPSVVVLKDPLANTNELYSSLTSNLLTLINYTVL